MNKPTPEKKNTGENDSAEKKRGSAFEETIAPEINGDTEGGFDTDEHAPPAKIGKYEIKRLLGRGGMGAVYLAHDTQLSRDVALKVPKFTSGTESKIVQRFSREARSAANLSHPNLCPVFDFGKDGDTYFIAMALIKGKPLSQYILPDRPPADRAVAKIIRKIALAMEEAHSSGILHRDLKPANVMIDHRKEPFKKCNVALV